MAHRPARWEAFLARVPLGRAAEPRDVVGAAIFFCSGASDFVTGQVLYVDGASRQASRKKRRVGTNKGEKTMKMRFALPVLVLLAFSGCALQDGGPLRARGATPKFAVDPYWPKPLPENWILGQVAGIAVDKNDLIWIVHRPNTLVDDEKGAQLNPPTTKCCKAAPPVMAFDRDGNLVEVLGRTRRGLRLVQAGARRLRRQGGQRVDRRQ
jgi:hypothetical protein